MQSPHKRQFGSHRAAPPSSSDDSSDDELFMGADKSDSEPEEYGSRQPAKSYETHHRGGSRPTKAPRDKHAPAEVSSKKRPSFLQQVVAVPKEVRRGMCVSCLPGFVNSPQRLLLPLQTRDLRKVLVVTTQAVFGVCTNLWTIHQ